MNIKRVMDQEEKIASVFSKEAVITDVQSALDKMMTVQYETGAKRIAVNKEAFSEQFFILSSGLAGEILQKFVQYRVKLAVYGDYSKYTSKPLRAFISESNRGRDIFFTDTEKAAIERLNA